jgi:hypothetical protein
MAGNFYRVHTSLLTGWYSVERNGEPLYDTTYDARELVFVDADDDPVFRVEHRIFDAESGYHGVDAGSGSVIGRLVDDVAPVGRRWAILDADGGRLATVREQGKLGALVYEVGRETSLPTPSRLEVVLPSGRRVGTLRKPLGAPDGIDLDLDPDLPFDERLVVAAAVILDSDDRLDRRIGPRTRGD